MSTPAKKVVKKAIKQAVKKEEKKVIKKDLKKKRPNMKKLAQSMSHSAGFGPVQGHGGYFGDLLGQAGSKLGDWLSDKALNWIGLGDYEPAGVHVDSSDIDKNTMLAGTSPPEITNKGQAFIFRHREYVGDVPPSITFSLSSYQINPGNIKLFNWLANLAGAFEEYQILGMIVEYKPLVSAVSENAIGAVVIASEYNPSKPNFANKVSMENYEYAVSCAPHHSMFHAIECDPKLTTIPHKQVLLGSIPSGEDPRLYNWANLQVATQGQANTTGVIGELWITYEIACFKPLDSISQGLGLLTDKFRITQVLAGSTALWSNFGGTANVCDQLGGTMSNAGVYLFPANVTQGLFLINLCLTPSANWSASSNISISGAAHCNLLQIFGGDGSLQVVVECINGTTQPATITAICTVNSPGALIAELDFAVLSAALTNTVYIDLIITQINGSITS